MHIDTILKDYLRFPYRSTADSESRLKLYPRAALSKKRFGNLWKWLHYRTKKIEKVQEYQCKDCYFYFSNERSHTCEKYKSILFKLTEQKEVEG